VPSRQPSTRCEFKGAARYLDGLIGDRRYQAVAWMYPQPSPGYDALKDHLAFYPGRIDAAWLNDERVRAQDSDARTRTRGPFMTSSRSDLLHAHTA
jgi:hypothetical protein